MARQRCGRKAAGHGRDGLRGCDVRAGRGRGAARGPGVLSLVVLGRRQGCAGQLHALNRGLGPGSRGFPGAYGASPDSPVGCGGGGGGQRGRPGAGEGGGWPGSGGSSVPPTAALSNAEG